MWRMRLYSLLTRRRIVPMLILSIAAIGFVPQVPACRHASGAADVTKAGGQSGACCRPAKPCSTPLSTCQCSCCSSGRQCGCGLVACQCTSPTHQGPISVPPRSTSAGHDPDVLVKPCVDAVVCEVAHSGWHSVVFISGSLLEAPTLQHQHVRIQT